MSGILNEAATPCPSRSRLDEHNSGSDTFDSLLGDDSSFEHTGEIEFTTEIRPSILTGARPRRANRAGSAFQILEDIEEKPTGPVEKRRRPNGLTRPPSDRKSSLLAQPAQRFRPKVNFVPTPPSRAANSERDKPGNPEALRTRASERNHCARQSTARSARENGEDGLKKDVRRGTVYIPPDDTTVASVFMGLFSPLKKNPGVAVPESSEETRINTLEAQIAKRQARKSLAVSARKAPLQPSSKIAQEAAIRVDIAGKNGGKENVPPGTCVNIKDKGTASSAFPKNRASTASERKPASRNASQLSTKPTAGALSSRKTTTDTQPPNRTALGDKQCNARLSVPRANQKKDVVTDPKKSLRNTSTLNAALSNQFSQSRVNQEKDLVTDPKKSLRNTSTLDARASALSVPSNHSSSNQTSSRTTNMPSKLKRLNREYPLLAEDIPRPALYDDDWLSHQETIITQLVNALFECTDGSSNTVDTDALRLELLELYHTDYFTHLYRRIQASLSCGTLSVPKDLLARNNRVKQDIGLRRKFLDIWIQSYDSRALVAAAETIVGRRVSSEPFWEGNGVGSPQECATGRKKTLIRKLEGFLDTFLLRNEDMDPSAKRRETPVEASAKAYRRTMLRSIMLVVLLDQSRQSPASTVPRRLFLSSSPFKSSAEVLQALARVLLPSGGDIAKPLCHLGCQLSFQQHPLQEYNYHIDNIAVDFRDGVRLTRIVEVLFFPSGHARSPQHDHTEVSLWTGEVLPLGDKTDLPLSRHLKFPCASRAAKVFNVQVALSALRSVKGSSKIISDLRAEDVVDGYREKTIALLWALVSKWGLAGLVDWDDMSKEIERLKCKAVAQLGYEQIKDEMWFTGEESDLAGDEHARLLHRWASILAALKGLRISNMTTSFADGRIFESVVDEYEPYITANIDRDSGVATSSLQSRLQTLGCSSQFAFLVSSDSTSSHILDRDFTLATLAFLCSRLLSASRRARAATTLQRAWRALLAERNTQQREIAKSLAVQCAAVVQTRNEILWAKEVITSWWRKTKARKQQRLTARSQPARKLDRPDRKTFGRRL